MNYFLFLQFYSKFLWRYAYEVYLCLKLNFQLMRTLFLALAFLCVLFQLNGQTIHHILSMPEPQTHYFHVQVELTDFNQENIIVALPTWAPGSYLIREFSKNIDLVKAKNQDGKSLPIKKVAKNRWEIVKAVTDQVVLTYEVYAFELTVRTSFLDLTHGYLNGSNVFMYPEGFKDLGGKLTVIPYKEFKKVSTALPELAEGVAKDNGVVFSFENYDHLADCPIEIGNHEEFEFTADGIPHRVAMYGAGNYDVERLKVDMAKIVEASTAVFGENPNKNYLFIIHNTLVGSGGLEHKNSTTLNVNRWTYEGDAYLGFLSLVAHEYFHLWLVKRLRPIILGPFDYNQENYTDLLWVMEGFTSYYDELILRRAGFYSPQAYVNKLQGTLNYVENRKGNQVQPIAHASYDAWIKAYRPNENSANTTISYYSKGHLVCAVLDAMLIDAHKGKKCMDDFLQVVYKKYYKERNRGFTEEEFMTELSTFIGKDLTDFFERHIYGTETINYADYFKKIGVNVEKSVSKRESFGVSTGMKNGRLIVNAVTAGSQAEKAGISPNDELIAFNGFRVDQQSFSSYMGDLSTGNEFVLIISRDDELMVINGEMGTSETVRYDFYLSDNKLTNYWLRLQD